jgi:hypothetical protein
MRSVAAGLAACVAAAVTVGCGTVTGSPSGSAANGSAGHKSGVPAASTAGARAAAGCLSLPAAGSVITQAGNGKTFCVRVGDKLGVFLSGTQANRWLPPLVSNDELTPIPDGALALAAGVTGVSFAAVRPGRVLVTSIRQACRAAIPSGKGGLEPGFPVARAYPLRFCAAGDRFSASVIVLG